MVTVMATPLSLGPRAVTSRLRLSLSRDAERNLRGGHPWVYSDSVRGQNREGTLGELAFLYDQNDRFFAIGLFDPDSPIRVRILHRGKPVTVTPEWWQTRFRDALRRRDRLFDSKTNGWRCIHGESDGWPGLVLDKYGTAYVLKIYSGVWLSRLSQIIELIKAEPDCQRIVLRLSRNIGPQPQAEFGVFDGKLLFGPPLSESVVFQETGLSFQADVLKGQKTGFFLDQRENRRMVESLAGGRRVLNAFSFSGGFSLYAARGGAQQVTDLDISKHALQSARENFQLNQTLRAVAHCQHLTVQADAFDWLEAARGPAFDLVIADPPSLARREKDRAQAMEAYHRLAANSLRLLRPGGILVAASCSAHVSENEFFGAVLAATQRSGRPTKELKRTGHPPDHPAGFKEACYLKCVYISVG